MMKDPQEIPCPIGTPIFRMVKKIIDSLAPAMRELVIIVPLEKDLYIKQRKSREYDYITLPYDKVKNVEWLAEYHRAPNFAITGYGKILKKEMSHQEGM